MDNDRSFVGASTKKPLNTWIPQQSSVDAELSYDLNALISRSRDLVRNNAVAASAIQTITDNVLGNGFRLCAFPDANKLGISEDSASTWSNNVECLWKEWTESKEFDAAGQLTFQDMSAVILKSSMVNGSSIVLPLWDESRSVYTNFQVIERDFLSNPNHERDKINLRSGIELDDVGRPVAYWLSKFHPGDLNLTGFRQEWQKISAVSDFGRRRIFHIFESDRSGQHTGKPIFAPVMLQLKMLDSYKTSELHAAIANANVAAFVETPIDSESFSNLFGGSIENFFDSQMEFKTAALKPGAILHMHPGEKISSFTPSRPNGEYSSFVKFLFREVAAGLNLPYEMLINDFSESNYSNTRAAFLQADKFFNSKRIWFTNHWLKPVYEMWFEEMVARNIIEAPNFSEQKQAWIRSRWIGPSKGWIDPNKEVEAAQLRLSTGLSTLQLECSAQGLDWEEVLVQRKKEQERLRELELDLTIGSDPLKPTLNENENND